MDSRQRKCCSRLSLPRPSPFPHWAYSPPPNSTTAAPEFSHLPTASQTKLQDYLMAAAGARARGLQAHTNAKHSCAFRLWQDFLDTIGFDSQTDPFLDLLRQPQRLHLIGAFAHAVRQAKFNPNQDTLLAASTVQDTISSLSAAFTENDQPNPILNPQGKTHQLLQLQLNAYKHTDSPIKHHQALPLELILQLYYEQSTPVDCCFGQLIILAFFFAILQIP